MFSGFFGMRKKSDLAEKTGLGILREKQCVVLLPDS